MGKDTFEFEIDDIVNSISIVNESMNISNLKGKSILKSLSLSGVKEPLNKKEKEDKKPKNVDFLFINILGVIVGINAAISLYSMDIYKYMALILNFGDFLVSLIFTCGVFFYIASNYLASFLWNRLGFDKALVALNLVNFSNLIGILSSRYFFLYEPLLARFAYGY